MRAEALAEVRCRCLLAPAVTGWMRPADGRTGGDVLEMVGTGGGGTMVILADACGHGAAAAGVADVIRAVATGRAGAGARPADVLDAVNIALGAVATDSAWCSALAVEVRPGIGRLQLTIARAGHPPPLVVRATGDVATMSLLEGGSLLGVYGDVRVPEHTLVLGAGDLLVGFTDGLDRPRGPSPREAGDRLRAVLRVVQPPDPAELIRAARTWLTRSIDDDAAIFAVSARVERPCRECASPQPCGDLGINLSGRMSSVSEAEHVPREGGGTHADAVRPAP